MENLSWKQRNPEKMKEYRRVWYANNRKEEQQKARERRRVTRQQMRAWFHEFKSTLKCEQCGETEICCLDFHHKDASEKDFTIGSKVQSSTPERIKAEAAKCVVLCSNCHRKVHNGLLG